MLYQISGEVWLLVINMVYTSCVASRVAKRLKT